ncbi:nucleoside diphosphate kinase homolog 5 isoform X2 [Engystomops pustulosus]|uniref:nucleoside diphosphate kinase homolog 5 isoform X2 n=1 Tax=Engystomops pustulosus TaxID=76066 RepID=UPI003AFA3A87
MLSQHLHRECPHLKLPTVLGTRDRCRTMSENQINNKEQSRVAPRIHLERTLAIIKPDVLHKAEEIEDIILRSGFHIVQETHFRSTSVPDIRDRYFVGWIHSANPEAKSRGVSIAFHKSLPLEILETKKIKVHLSPEKCSDFYSEQYGKMFFPSLTAYMSSGPIIALKLARQDAINIWRKLMGPSNSLKAKEMHPESIRAIYGTDELRNAVHGSYCLTSAEREIPFMFPQAPIEPTSTGEVALDYLDLFVNPALISGLFHLCKEKPSDPYLWLADWLLKHNTNRPEVCDKAN